MLNTSGRIPPEIEDLRASGCSLIIYCSDGSVLTKNSRGVADLLHLYESGKSFSGAVIADKVVGKGAAAMMIALGFKRCLTPVASTAAIELLHYYGVATEALETVDYIINRKGTGRCPVETLLDDVPVEDLGTMIERIKKFVASMNK